MVIASIEHIGKRPVPRLVLAYICVEQIHRHDMPGLTCYAVLPGPDMDLATFDVDRSPLVDRFSEIIDRPRNWFLALATLAVHSLEKISAPVQQGHRHHRHV